MKPKLPRLHHRDEKFKYVVTAGIFSIAALGVLMPNASPLFHSVGLAINLLWIWEA